MGLTYPSNKVCPRCGAAGYVWYAEYNRQGRMQTDVHLEQL